MYEYRESKRMHSENLMKIGVVIAFSTGTAGSVPAIIRMPFDVMKTQIMLSAAGSSGEKKTIAAKAFEKQGEGVKAESAKRSRPGGLAVGKEVWRISGVIALSRGGALRGLWTALRSGLYLRGYGSGRYSEKRREDDGNRNFFI